MSNSKVSNIDCRQIKRRSLTIFKMRTPTKIQIDPHRMGEDHGHSESNIVAQPLEAVVSPRGVVLSAETVPNGSVPMQPPTSPGSQSVVGNDTSEGRPVTPATGPIGGYHPHTGEQMVSKQLLHSPFELITHGN